MKFTVTFDCDEDGAWGVECPSIPGCVSQGKTKEEATENIKDAIKLCLEVRAERGMPLTIESRQVEVPVLWPRSRSRADARRSRPLKGSGAPSQGRTGAISSWCTRMRLRRSPFPTITRSPGGRSGA